MKNPLRVSVANVAGAAAVLVLSTAAAASGYVEVGSGDTLFLQRPFCGS